MRGEGSHNETRVYSEILNSEENKLKYKKRLDEALKLAQDYHGTESEYKAFIENLDGLEKWLAEIFDTEKGMKLPAEIEEQIIKSWQYPQSKLKIDDVLDIGANSLNEVVSKTLKEKKEEESAICTVDLGGIILPPDSKPIPKGNGEGELKEIKFQDRIQELVTELVANGIFTDDIILAKGQVSDRMMRKLSYVIVEIPKLGREVLVCDQVGEVTFVIYGILDRKMLLSMGKEELQEKFGARVIKVVYRDPGQWKGEVLGNLLKDVDVNALEKINVKELEGLRTEILKVKPTPESWVEMKTREKLAFKIAGLGLSAIVRKFDVIGHPAGNQEIHLELGKKIYGEGHECLEIINKDKVKAEILKVKPSLDSWNMMKTNEKLEFKVAGLGLIGIARIFGLEDNPISKHAVHIELGKKIYNA
ncbi:MAG: hypothetical protein AAB348_01740 [Patescibacteria group bacterium]